MQLGLVVRRRWGSLLCSDQDLHRAPSVPPALRLAQRANRLAMARHFSKRMCGFSEYGGVVKGRALRQSQANRNMSFEFGSPYQKAEVSVSGLANKVLRSL